MKGINERELLPIIRGAVSGDMDKIRIFLEYKGWAFDFQLINRDSEYTWTLDGAEINIVQENRDDYSIVISDNTSIKVHFHSFLWNM